MSIHLIGNIYIPRFFNKLISLSFNKQLNTFKMSFSNKVVIVTGASSGIGATTAVMFAQEGANVTIVGRNETKLMKVAETIKKAGKNLLLIKADITKDKEVNRVVKETIDKFGRIDVLVNNAGLAVYGSLLDEKIVKAYDETLSINLRAVINLTTAAIPHIVKSKGNIVNISSAGAMSLPITSEFLPYHISKAGLDMFTRGAALELAPLGVRVNSVNPGPVRTDFLDNTGIDINWDNLAEMTSLGRTADCEEIGDLVMYLSGEKARGITGSIYLIDNGYLLKK